jgi:phosphopantetheine--protein transferase-like protein
MTEPALESGLREGVAVVDVQTFAQMLRTDDGPDVVAEVCRPEERERSAGDPEQLILLWVAKEAVLKALGLGLREASLFDVELTGSLSGPEVELHGRAAARAACLGAPTPRVTTSRLGQLVTARASSRG